MSLDEIRRQKADVLLEYQECEDRVHSLAHQVRDLSGKLDRFARLLNPGEPNNITAPRLAEIQAEELSGAINFDHCIKVASDLKDALVKLAEAAAKKQALRLR